MVIYRGSTLARATAVHMTGVMVGAGLGGWGGWLAGRHDGSYAFTLFGMIGGAYAVVLILLLREAPRENVADNHGGGMTDPVRFQDAWVSLFSRSAFILALAFWGLNGLVGWALVGWLPTYLGERFQLSQGAAGLSATGYLQGASLLGVLIGGAWADRWSRRNERGRLFVPAIGFCLAAPAIFLASVTSLLPLAIGGLVLYGVGRAFADSNMMPILCLVADPRYRATGYGILNLCSCVIGGLTIYAGGALRDAEFNVRLLFQAAAASLVICAGFLALIKPSLRPAHAKTPVGRGHPGAAAPARPGSLHLGGFGPPQAVSARARFMRSMASSISARSLKPMTIESISGRDRAKRIERSRSAGLVKSPLPMIFMPMMPRPLARMVFSSASTGSRLSPACSRFVPAAYVFGLRLMRTR